MWIADTLQQQNTTKPAASERHLAFLATALDMDLPEAKSADEAWPLGRTILFAGSVSCALWAIIIGVAWLI